MSYLNTENFTDLLFVIGIKISIDLMRVKPPSPLRTAYSFILCLRTVYGLYYYLAYCVQFNNKLTFLRFSFTLRR